MRFPTLPLFLICLVAGLLLPAAGAQAAYLYTDAPDRPQVEAGRPTTFTAYVDEGRPATGIATWNFDDGTPPEVRGPDSTVVHTFTTYGAHLVEVRIMNESGQITSVISSIYYVVNGSPRVHIGALPINLSLVDIIAKQGRMNMLCSTDSGPTCRMVAHIEPELQQRLGLPTDVIGSGADPTRTRFVNIQFKAAALAALAALHEDFTLRLEGIVGSGTRSVTTRVSWMAWFNECPYPASATLFCWPLRGKQANEASPGEKGNSAWPGITGIRRNPVAPDDAGQQLDGTYLSDALFGGHGSDIALGGDGDDVIKGDNMVTPVVNAQQADRLYGSDGHDWIYAGPGKNTIAAGTGDDRVYALVGSGTIDCGAGNDRVVLRKAARAKKTRRHPHPKQPKAPYRLTSCEKVTRR